jgi:hypothetical protein
MRRLRVAADRFGERAGIGWALGAGRSASFGARRLQVSVTALGFGVLVRGTTCQHQAAVRCGIDGDSPDK